MDGHNPGDPTMTDDLHFYLFDDSPQLTPSDVDRTGLKIHLALSSPTSETPPPSWEDCMIHSI